VPYRAVIAKGVDAIMTGHCVYPAIDLQPATLSRPILEGICRRDLGYRGLIITDGLVMDAIYKQHGIAPAAIAALRAGVDAVLPLARERETIDSIAVALESGDIDDASIKERISRLETLGLRSARRPQLPVVSLAGHASIASTVAHRSLTLIEGALPRFSRTDAIVLVELPFDRASPVEDTSASHSAAAVLQTFFPRLVHIRVSADAIAGAVETLTDIVGPALLLTRDQAGVEGMREFAGELALRGPLVHVAMRSPHDLVLSAGTGAVRVAAYSDTPPTIVALAEKLLTGGPWLGRLPVPRSWTELDPEARATAESLVTAPAA
jgi:beta-N-acetylhexosaminidase